MKNTEKVLEKILKELNGKIDTLNAVYQQTPKEYRHEVSGERAIWIEAAKIVHEYYFNELNKETPCVTQSKKKRTARAK